MTEIKLVNATVDEVVDKLIEKLTNLNLIQGSRSQESGEPAYLSPAQLAEKFGYSADWFRDRIRNKQFGKIARTGDYFATYEETEKYLFEKNKPQ